jgi:hypothetical protein
MLLATIVDWEALLETGIAALVAGVGVAFTASLAILGAARFIESSREQRSLHAAAFALVGLIGLAATAAAIVAGIIVMTTD